MSVGWEPDRCWIGTKHIHYQFTDPTHTVSIDTEVGMGIWIGLCEIAITCFSAGFLIYGPRYHSYWNIVILSQTYLQHEFAVDKNNHINMHEGVLTDWRAVASVWGSVLWFGAGNRVVTYPLPSPHDLPELQTTTRNMHHHQFALHRQYTVKYLPMYGVEARTRDANAPTKRLATDHIFRTQNCIAAAAYQWLSIGV